MVSQGRSKHFDNDEEVKSVVKNMVVGAGEFKIQKQNTIMRFMVGKMK